MAIDLEEAARRLAAAQRERRPIPPFGDFPILDAYRVQDFVVEARLGAGERRIGAKIGLTSLAKQRQLGLDQPVAGWLTDAMLVADGARAPLALLIHPRVEPEIGFILGRPLRARETVESVLEATEAVFGGFEIVDSRYEGFKFGMADVIADNTSCAGVVLGPGRPAPAEVGDLREVSCTLKVDGEPVATARGEEVLGHPAAAVAWLAGFLAERGQTLAAGSIVISGGMTEFVPLEPGRVISASFSGRLGDVSVSG